MQPLVFADYGWAHVHTPLDGEQTDFQLASIGAGLRYQLRPCLTANADYGWQLKTVSAGTARARRAHINVSLSW